MRTGAIFARGSCRALKWMALVGMVFMLGGGSAAAQATFTDATWTPESDEIRINMNNVVWTRSATEVAKDFTVSWGTGADAMSATGTTSTISTDVDDPKAVFMVKLDKAIPTGAGGADGQTGITVAYDGPAGGGDADVTNAQGILDNTEAHGATADASSITVIEGMVDPTLPDLEDQTLRKDVALTATTAIQLPAAMGNIAFTYLVSDLPSGLTFDADGADDAVGGTGLDRDRLIIGTPDMAEEKDVRYVVTDRNSRSVSGTFMITVNDVPDAPEMPTVTPTTNTSGSLDVMWDAPDDNNSPILYYQVQYKETSATAWMVPPTNVLSGTSHTFTGLTDGTSYDFQVQAINGVGMSGYSPTGMGTPMASGAVPAAPAAPTVTATANTRGSLDVTWVAPADSGSAISDYELQYKMSSASNWTTESDAVTGTSTMLTGLSDATMYDVQVRARNTNGSGPWSPSGQGTTIAAPTGPDPTAALITKIEVSGSEKRRIGSVDRLHVDEGDRANVSVTVEWTKADLRAIHDAGNPQDAYVYLIASSVVDAADWLSPAEVTNVNGQDVPDQWEAIRLPLPKRPKDTDPGRETVSVTESAQHTWLNDADAEDEALTLGIGTTSRGVSFGRDSKLVTDTIVIEDSDDQLIQLKRTSTGAIFEGGADVEFEVSAKPALVDLTIDIGFNLTDADGAAVPSRAFGLTPARDSIGAGDDKIEVAIDLDDNDGNRHDEELTLHAQIASRNRDDIEDASMSFTVLDVHKLPWLTVDPVSSTVAEGGEIELTLTLDRNPRNTRAVDPETVQYTLEPIDVMVDMLPEGIEIMPRPVKFPKHSGKASDGWTEEMTVKVTAKPNDDIDGERMVALTFEAAGTVAANGMGSEEGDYHMAVATLTIEDDTESLVWAKSLEEVEAAVMAAKKAGMGDDMMFTAGEMIELEGNDLFGSAQGVSVGYSAMVEGDAVSYSESGGVVTITADSMGMAKVTITARASRPSGAVMINDQTDPREASITVALEVGLVALSIELSGPEEMNIVEGGMGGMVTATANRAVTEDTVVDLMRDRAMSSAEDADFTAEPITIMAGQMKGSTMVMAVEDNMMENDDNMAEELVLYGMAADNAGEVTGYVKFYIWDAAVPALPVIAQLLLAAFLAVGGYRRYRRR